MSSFVIPSYPTYYNEPGVLGKLQSGTTIIACEFDGGVIVGADSQKTSGNYIYNRMADKLMKINDYIYCSGSGNVAEIQSIIDKTIYQLHEPTLNGKSVLAVASVIRGLVYSDRSSNVELLVVGWDEINKGQIYSISSGGMMKGESVCALGSGSLFVYGYLDAHFEKSMTKEEAVCFMSKTMTLAFARDCLSGGQLSLAMITNAKIERCILCI